MPGTYFRLFTTMLRLTSPFEECVHNPISFPDASNVTRIIYGSFTYCKEFFSISNGVTSFFPTEIMNILTNHNCTEKINSTLSHLYNFACEIIGFTDNSSEIAAIFPEINITTNYSMSCYPIIKIPQSVELCFSSVIEIALDKADELQAALNESTKQKIALLAGSVVMTAGLAYSFYTLYNRYKKQKIKQEISVIEEKSLDGSLSTSDIPYDLIEPPPQSRLNI